MRLQIIFTNLKNNSLYSDIWKSRIKFFNPFDSVTYIEIKNQFSMILHYSSIAFYKSSCIESVHNKCIINSYIKMQRMEWVIFLYLKDLRDFNSQLCNFLWTIKTINGRFSINMAWSDFNETPYYIAHFSILTQIVTLSSWNSWNPPRIARGDIMLSWSRYNI